MFLGVDTGGTFTDFVYFSGKDVRFRKVLSTPHDPSRAIAQGIRELGLATDMLHLVHGSTVATNAILERKGVRTLFVTHKGLEDLIAIGRQTREELYELCPQPKALLLDRDNCFGLSGRMDAEGREIESLDTSDLAQLAELAKNYDAVAVCLLFSFLNPEHEQKAGQALPENVFVSLSHEVLAEYREYERASSTYLNAYVGPKVQLYLERLASELEPKHLFVMHSAGGVMAADEAGRNAVRMVLSGPAGGLVAAQHTGKQLDIDQLLSFDMGGTSTDVALLEKHASITTEGNVAGIPVAVPMLDIHTIGAGGGSLAWLDEAGLPQVGPESAGADPGPACYGKGGRQATVTDANIVLGKIPANTKLAGSMPLNIEAAKQAVGKLAGPLKLSIEEAASGIIRIAEEHMAGALRVVSVQRGHDPKRFSLLCFGGAGGLHACRRLFSAWHADRPPTVRSVPQQTSQIVPWRNPEDTRGDFRFTGEGGLVAHA
jgi:N-methylhydantoinase A